MSIMSERRWDFVLAVTVALFLILAGLAGRDSLQERTCSTNTECAAMLGGDGDPAPVEAP